MKKFFHKIHVAIYRWYTFLLIGMATKAVHKLMLMIGKDPNASRVVEPLPSPFPEVAPYFPLTVDDAAMNRAWIVDTKARGNVWLVTDGYYVHHPEAHPIVKSRIAYQEKLAKQAAEKAVREAEQKAAEIAQQALQVTSVGGEAVDALREATFNVERAVIDPDDKAN